MWLASAKTYELDPNGSMLAACVNGAHSYRVVLYNPLEKNFYFYDLIHRDTVSTASRTHWCFEQRSYIHDPSVATTDEDDDDDDGNENDVIPSPWQRMLHAHDDTGGHHFIIMIGETNAGIYEMTSAFGEPGDMHLLYTPDVTFRVSCALILQESDSLVVYDRTTGQLTLYDLTVLLTKGTFVSMGNYSESARWSHVIVTHSGNLWMEKKDNDVEEAALTVRNVRNKNKKKALEQSTPPVTPRRHHHQSQQEAMSRPLQPDEVEIMFFSCTDYTSQRVVLRPEGLELRERAFHDGTLVPIPLHLGRKNITRDVLFYRGKEDAHHQNGSSFNAGTPTSTNNPHHRRRSSAVPSSSEFGAMTNPTKSNLLLRAIHDELPKPKKKTPQVSTSGFGPAPPPSSSSLVGNLSVVIPSPQRRRRSTHFRHATAVETGQQNTMICCPGHCNPSPQTFVITPLPGTSSSGGAHVLVYLPTSGKVIVASVQRNNNTNSLTTLSAIHSPLSQTRSEAKRVLMTTQSGEIVERHETMWEKVAKLVESDAARKVDKAPHESERNDNGAATTMSELNRILKHFIEDQGMSERLVEAARNELRTLITCEDQSNGVSSQKYHPPLWHHVTGIKSIRLASHYSKQLEEYIETRRGAATHRVRTYNDTEKEKSLKRLSRATASRPVRPRTASVVETKRTTHDDRTEDDTTTNPLSTKIKTITKRLHDDSLRQRQINYKRTVEKVHAATDVTNPNAHLKLSEGDIELATYRLHSQSQQPSLRWNLEQLANDRRRAAESQNKSTDDLATSEPLPSWHPTKPDDVRRLHEGPIERRVRAIEKLRSQLIVDFKSPRVMNETDWLGMAERLHPTPPPSIRSQRNK